MSCNNCQREYVRRAHRCVKHTASCYNKSQYELKDMTKYDASLFEVQGGGITQQELNEAAQCIQTEDGQLLQATGQTMPDGTVLVSVVEGDQVLNHVVSILHIRCIQSLTVIIFF